MSASPTFLGKFAYDDEVSPCSMFKEMVERIEDLEDALAVIQAKKEPRISLEEYLKHYKVEQSEEVPALS